MPLMAASLAGRLFVWNLSASLPRGLYRLDRSAPPTRGAVVTFAPPPAVAAMIVARRYLPPAVSLMKVVVALPGDLVCVDDDGLFVSGKRVAAIALQDSAGRPLDPFRFCEALPHDVAFVVTGSPLSFDSRYFGPVPLASLTVAVPAWTF